MNKINIFILAASFLIFFGCATRGEVKRFRVQLDYIEASNARMQKDIDRLDSLIIEQQKLMRSMKAEQSIGLTQLDQDMKVIVGLLDESGLRVNRLNERMESLRRDIIYQPQTPDDLLASDSTDTLTQKQPFLMLNQIYESAYLDQKRGNYETAIENYRFFLDELAEQESVFADDVQYGIAECLFSMEKYNESNVEYQKLIDNYPESDLVPPALYKKGIIYQRLGKVDLAKIVFNRLIKNYPTSPEADLSRDRLENLSIR